MEYVYYFILNFTDCKITNFVLKNIFFLQKTAKLNWKIMKHQKGILFSFSYFSFVQIFYLLKTFNLQHTPA